MTTPVLPSLSPVVAGCWRTTSWGMDTPKLLGWIESCLDMGITSFDHADLYGGYAVQPLFGQALALKPSLRSQMQIVSKAGICCVHENFPERQITHYDSSASHLIASCEQSLRELQTDFLDVFLIHRPDPLSDWDEIAQAFEQLRKAGKVRAFGVSNFTTDQFSALHRRIALLTNQIEFSVLHTTPLHDGTLLQAQELQTRPMIWSPLAGGRLFTGEDAQSQRMRAAFNAIAKELGVSAATLAYAWVLRHPSRPHLITGSHRLESLREAIQATSLQLTRQQWTHVWQASMGHPVP
jgi:predicted oxidoreductase